MELKQLWAVMVRRWWLVLLPAIVALILTLPSLRAAISPPVNYTVTIRFTASQVPPSDATHSFQDQSYIPWLASEYAINNLATWMRTESFVHEIADRLQAQGKTVDLSAVCSPIASDSARSIMTLYLTCSNPDDTGLIAQAAIDVLRERSQAYFPQLAAQKTEIIPLDAPLFRVLTGLAAGLALAFLVEYLDPTIRDRREIEALDLPVIAEIPRWR
jgi:capsular polysaccharide biosynthesis protein